MDSDGVKFTNMSSVIIQVGIILVDFLLLSLVLFGTPGDTKNRAQVKRHFIYFSGFILLWLLLQLSYDLVTDIRIASIVAKASIVTTMCLALSFYRFAEVISLKVSKKFYWHIILVSIFALASLLPTYIKLTKAATGEIEYSFDPFWYTLFTLPPIYHVFIGLRRLFSAVLSSRVDNKRRKQIKQVLYGMMAAGILVLIGNYVLPLLNLDNYGAVFIILGPSIVIASLSYAIFTLKLFNFRKFFYRAVTYAIVLLLVFGLTSGAAALIFVAGFRESLRSLSDAEYALAISGFTVMGVIAFRASGLLVDRLSSRFYYRHTFNSDKVYLELEPYFRSIDLAFLCNGFTTVLKNELGVDSVAIYVRSAKPGDKVEEYMFSTDKQPNNTIVSKIRSLTDSSSTIKNIEKAADISDYELFFPLTHRGVQGFLLIGHKHSGRPIYTDERAILKNIAADLSLALQNSFQYETIVAFNKELEEKILKATSALRHTNKKLKALDEAKDEFISMASHQLRTPLTSVKGYISMVMEGDAGKVAPEQKKLLDEAFASSQRMVYLIADLLNVSRLRTGKFEIEPSEIYLPDIIEEEIAQLKPTLSSRRLKIRFDKPSRFPKIWLDETKIRQVIMNFIDNAIYYTRSGGEITVNLISRRNSIECNVIDNGIGVPKAEQAKLFTKFFRAGNARQARPDGTGLGLYMAQRVVSAQGGAILFKSEEGKGSTFGFRFPLSSIKTKQSLLKQLRVRQTRSEPGEQ